MSQVTQNDLLLDRARVTADCRCGSFVISREINPSYWGSRRERRAKSVEERQSSENAQDYDLIAKYKIKRNSKAEAKTL